MMAYALAIQPQRMAGCVRRFVEQNRVVILSTHEGFRQWHVDAIQTWQVVGPPATVFDLRLFRHLRRDVFRCWNRATLTPVVIQNGDFIGGKDAASRCSPAEVVQVEKTIITGRPDVDRLSTSHVEKQNHTLRMHCRRLTRLTNAFSKKLENFEAAVALNFAHYNFVKTHGAIRMTSAQAAGVENSAWTVSELVERCGE